MKTRTVIAGAAIAVFAIGVGFYASADHGPVVTPATTAVKATAAPMSPSLASSTPPTAVAPPSSAQTTPAETLRTSHDYYEYAQSLFAAAKAGDHQAQFNLSRALHYCDDAYRGYFETRGHLRTLDEAMQWATKASPSLNADEARTVYARCHRLKDKSLPAPPFGNSDDWLLAASNGGYPLAQVTLARDLFTESIGGEDTGKREEAKRLAAQALLSKDPAVLWESADLVLLYTNDMDETMQRQWVWRMAACQRGYDCSSNNEWLVWACRYDRNCQPYETMVDYIHRHRSEDFDEIEQKARDLNAKLDADNSR